MSKFRILLALAAVALSFRLLQPMATGVPLADSCWFDAECAAATCCHADRCTHWLAGPACSGFLCSMNCQGDTMDCGGRCVCESGRCGARVVPRRYVPRSDKPREVPVPDSAGE